VQSIISVTNLTKTYASGFQALKNINLEIRRGEIFALLGPNGAGKTTLIGVVCGTVNPTSGRVVADGHDIIRDYRAAREKISQHIEKVLRELSLWDKRSSKIMTLSGGMKRRVLIAKALSHEPQILFLDEPTAGVDVDLRRDMWQMVRSLRETGVTIILTTHYIEEAEQMADRIGIINKGEIILVEEKAALMEKLGKKELILQLQAPLSGLPPELSEFDLALSQEGRQLTYTFHAERDRSKMAALLRKLAEQGIEFKDLQTRESSLEDIFVNLVRSTS